MPLLALPQNNIPFDELPRVFDQLRTRWHVLHAGKSVGSTQITLHDRTKLPIAVATVGDEFEDGDTVHSQLFSCPGENNCTPHGPNPRKTKQHRCAARMLLKVVKDGNNSFAAYLARHGQGSHGAQHDTSDVAERFEFRRKVLIVDAVAAGQTASDVLRQIPPQFVGDRKKQRASIQSALIDQRRRVGAEAPSKKRTVSPLCRLCCFSLLSFFFVLFWRCRHNLKRLSVVSTKRFGVSME